VSVRTPIGVAPYLDFPFSRRLFLHTRMMTLLTMSVLYIDVWVYRAA